MEALIVLIIVAVLLLPVIALASASAAKSRVAQLENQVDRLAREVDRLSFALTKGEDRTTARATSASVVKKSADISEQNAGMATVVPDAVDNERAPEPEATSSQTQLPVTGSAIKKAGLFQDKVPPKTRANKVTDVQPVEGPKKPTQTVKREGVVFNEANRVRFQAFIGEYWAYILGALSMMLGGIYLVRLGIERNIITPPIRVAFALLVGAGFIYAAEHLRNRFGDETGQGGEYIPSIFAATGFATIYGALIGATSLYGLIGVGTAFVLLVLVAVVAVVAGLRFGLLLSALGALGAYLAPLILGSGSPYGFVMLGYALVIMAVVMVVDSAKRSGWLSGWGMVLCAGFAWLVIAGRLPLPNSANAYGLATLGFSFVYLMMVVVIPERRIVPTFALIDDSDVDLFPKSFPARIVFGAQIVVILGFLTAFSLLSASSFVPIIVAFAFLIGIYFFWFNRAPALTILPVIPIGLAIFWLVSAYTNGRVGFGTSSGIFGSVEARSIILIGVVLSLVTSLYSYQVHRFREFWAYLALALPVTYTIGLWLNWQIAPTIDLSPWVLIFGFFGINSAALYLYHFRKRGLKARIVEIAALSLPFYGVVFASLFDGQYLSLVAATLITLWLVWAYFAFDWQLHQIFARLGSVIMGLSFTSLFVRFSVFDLTSITGSNFFEIALVGAIVSAVAYGVYRYIGTRDEQLRNYFESLAFLSASIAIFALAYHVVVIVLGITSNTVILVLYSLIFFAQAVAIKLRMKVASGFNTVRQIVYVTYSLIAALLMAINVLMNPYFTHEFIVGAVVFNAMIITFLVPAALLIFAGRRGFIPGDRRIWSGIALGLVALWFLMNVRVFWQGNLIGFTRPATQGELFSYTLLMLIGMVVMMYNAVTKRNTMYRRIALGLLIIVAFKTYFIDLAQFDNGLRTAALFILGMLLIGFSFVDRKTRVIMDNKGS